MNISHRLPRLAAGLSFLAALAARGDALAAEVAPPAAGGSVASANVAAVQSFRPALEREWCTGASPASWGFAVTPTEECFGIHVRARSTSVKITSLQRGPGAPEGWTAAQVGDREIALTGNSPIPAGGTLPTALLIETNRATATLGTQGASAVEWEVWFTDAGGQPTQTGRMNASFPPVLDLADAAARGIILVTCEALGPWGPVEITVDNPTVTPLWVDVPTGSTIMAGGKEWIVGLTPPFRMMRRQKAGMTVNAFPVDAVPPDTMAPRRLTLGARDGKSTARIQAVALAARRLRESGRQKLRNQGPFEQAEPYDFFPLVLTWHAWQVLPTPPPRQMLIDNIASLLRRKAGSGDPLAAGLNPDACVAEVEEMVSALAAEIESVRADALPVDLQCAHARCR